MKPAAWLAGAALSISVCLICPIGESGSKKRVSDHAWPTDASSEPKEEEWARATELETVKPDIELGWWREGVAVVCTQRVIRNWIRITCTPQNVPKKDDMFFGVVWGLAGDLENVKGQFVMASELERYKAPPTDVVGDLTRKMGASATVTFQVTPGSAFVLNLAKIGWDHGYEGSVVITRIGVLIDVSWALGEKVPTILYR
jgi:hypothetical protein